MASCPHKFDLSKLQQPKLSQSVHREECTQCFDNQVRHDRGETRRCQCAEGHVQDSDDGIDVCLVCFNGACLGPDRHHARTHVARSGHAFTLNVKRKLKPNFSGRVRIASHERDARTD